MKRGAFVLGLLAVLCCGCVSPQVKTYAVPSTNKKLCIVSASNTGLGGELKDVMRSLGWRITSKPRVLTRTHGTNKDGNIDTVTESGVEAPFELRVNYAYGNGCLCTCYAGYEITMIDNYTGDSLFTLTPNSLVGQDCVGTIKSNFEKQLYALFGDESKLPPMEDSGLPKVE